MYARGILFGKMKYELGDHSFVRCPELGLSADIDFKTKGWVSGTYNAIGGVIKDDHTGEILYELSGLWSEEMFIKDLKVRLKTLSRWAVTNHPDTVTDWTQGAVLQRPESQAQSPDLPAPRGTRRAGIATAVGQDCASGQGAQSRTRHRGEDQDRRGAARSGRPTHQRRRRVAPQAVPAGQGRPWWPGGGRGRPRMDHQRISVRRSCPLLVGEVTS